MSAVKTIENLCRDFARAIETHFVARANAALMAPFTDGEMANSKPSRVGPNVRVMVPTKSPHPSRRKGPVQICPHPGCKARSAPVFSMMCAKHKNDPKASIKKWREARRAAKARG